MTSEAEKYLQSIAPRPLTADELRTYQLLCLKEGSATGVSGVAEIIVKSAQKSD